MQITRVSLHRLVHGPHDFDVVVAIDVLRSFTTAAYALAGGTPAIYPVETSGEANHLRRALPEAITVGALPGGRPMPGFDFGNSPSDLRDRSLAGNPVILTTAAGVRALVRFRDANRLFAASLVCAGATLRAVQSLAPQRVALITTGEWIDRDGDEDIACADYLAAGLRGEPIDVRALEQRVRNSDFGRRFASGLDSALPPDDLTLCAQADRFDFAMPVIRKEGRLAIVASPPIEKAGPSGSFLLERQ